MSKCMNRGATTTNSVGCGSSSSVVTAAATTKTTIPPKGSFYPVCSGPRRWNQVLRVGAVVLAWYSSCFQLVVLSSCCRCHVDAEAIPVSNFFEGSRHLGISSRANNNYYVSIDEEKAKKGTSTSLAEGEKHGRSPCPSGRGLATTATTPTTTSSSLPRSNTSNGSGSSTSSILPIRVAYQGEPGAYSEKATRELLGDGVMAVAQPNFESCFQAVAVRRDCDFACIPVENSLGGSIHENYDLMLRYPSLSIVAEHEFRVHHCLLVSSPHIRSKQDIRYAISHPQALAQCDTYLRTLGITPIPLYDTAGSAKLLADAAAAAAPSYSSTNTDDPSSSSTTKPILPPGCTPQNTAAIASDLAGMTYGLHCLEKGIEDDDSNFTRFLLLGRQSVLQFLHNKQIPSKTSIVFTLPNQAGALYKALACFSLRDIDFSKIESRPTSASLLSFLKFRSQLEGGKSSKHPASSKMKLPRFRYCFYLDFLKHESDEDAQNALHHLREQADFCRVLGSYPQKSRLVGPVAFAAEEMKKHLVKDEPLPRDRDSTHNSEENHHRRVLKIGIVGYGRYGQFLARKLSKRHHVIGTDVLVDKSGDEAIEGDDINYYPPSELSAFLRDLDVILLTTPLIDFERVVAALPKERLRGKLVVEVCPLSTYPKSILERNMPSDVDIICASPMFGPSGTSNSPSSWSGLPFVYEKVRVNDVGRANSFLSIFEDERCKMVEMTAEQLDASNADAEFVTHLTGRLLNSEELLPPVMVSTKEYAALLDVAEKTTPPPGGEEENSTFDMFYGLFKFNPNAKNILDKVRLNLAKIERQLVSKEAHLKAKAEMQDNDRQRMIDEFKMLLQEAANEASKDLPQGKERIAPKEEVLQSPKLKLMDSTTTPNDDDAAASAGR